MRRLIVFSDPGGAKPCLSLAKKWQASDELLLCSDRQYAFFEMFGVRVRHCNGLDAPAIFAEFKPENLYTGTSYTSRIEMDFIREAAKRGIPSASFVDHYTGFDVRFGTAEARILPDEIHVLDHKAAALAREAGLPESRIRITGNPYHEFLRSWQSQLTKEEVFQQLGIPVSEAKTILFAPDPLSNAGGADKFGTDEVAILGLLLEALGEIGKPIQLLIKAHPNQSMDYLKTGLKYLPRNVEVHLVTSEKDALLNDLIQHADLVAGMFSSLLIEAELLGAKTLRILCGITIPDPLAGQSAGAVLMERNQISSELQNLLN
jgi:CDP-glycerol glycerophosphotransferase (TagB/SpsB family)